MFSLACDVTKIESCVANIPENENEILNWITACNEGFNPRTQNVSVSRLRIDRNGILLTFFYAPEGSVEWLLAMMQLQLD